MSLLVMICLTILVSSANIPHSFPGDSSDGKSLTYNKNLSGPRVAPWGTPDVHVTGAQSE